MCFRVAQEIRKRITDAMILSITFLISPGKSDEPPGVGVGVGLAEGRVAPVGVGAALSLPGTLTDGMAVPLVG